ncbi:ATP-binding protein [Azospirillum sp. Sh1]|uniref:PAS domain-containing sensor histidine kinase n=1 Tax=Azospirillum sp. Sh1 TaxID=2607285 RepID=UPI0011EBA408|nr:ATP-binding protein [Azospirillum sp. Sh1]KAA0570851.1 PAS domain-containing protein [Azospirillum sp. Sh1]
MSNVQGLRDSKAWPLVIQLIWDRLDQAVIITDRALAAPGPTIRYVNRAFTRLTGYRADEVIGRSPRMLQCGRTDKPASAAIMRDLRDGRFARGTLVNRRKDGSEYLCSMVIAPLIGPSGETEHFICVADELKKDRSSSAFQRLYDELERAQTLIEDLEGWQTEADSVFARQRCELNALTVRHDATLLQLDQVQERLALRESALDRFSKASNESSTELRASREELRVIGEELRLSLKQVEEANAHLAESNEELQRLRAADAAKLRLLGSASHDLRQPVMSMGLFLDVLRHRLGDAERPILGGLLAAHLSIRTLLDGMLDTARLDAGALEPAIEPVPMPVMFESISGEFAIQAEMRGIRFRVVPCHAEVLSDAQLLERILRNLLANALKYTASGTILLGCRRCRDAQGRLCLRIEVWDSGPGIEEANQAAIFEEFRQLDTTSRDQRRGVGLGLAIVSRLARQLGHRIGLRSCPGRGSVFSVMVPLVQQSGDRRKRRQGIRGRRRSTAGNRSR